MSAIITVLERLAAAIAEWISSLEIAEGRRRPHPLISLIVVIASISSVSFSSNWIHLTYSILVAGFLLAGPPLQKALRVGVPLLFFTTVVFLPKLLVGDRTWLILPIRTLTSLLVATAVLRLTGVVSFSRGLSYLGMRELSEAFLLAIHQVRFSLSTLWWSLLAKTSRLRGSESPFSIMAMGVVDLLQRGRENSIKLEIALGSRSTTLQRQEVGWEALVFAAAIVLPGLVLG